MLGGTSVTDGGSYTRALKIEMFHSERKEWTEVTTCVHKYQLKDLKVKKKSTKGRNLRLVLQVLAKKG